MTGLIALIQKTKETMDDLPPEKKETLMTAMISLSKKLLDQVNGLMDIPESYHVTLCPAMIAQLHAAERRTEKAADDILSAAEGISNALARVEGPGKTEIQTRINAIFEASSFQDLVSQHLNETKLLIDDLSVDMDKLQRSFDVLNGSESMNRVALKTKEKRSDAHLLNGPSTHF